MHGSRENHCGFNGWHVGGRQYPRETFVCLEIHIARPAVHLYNLEIAAYPEMFVEEAASSPHVIPWRSDFKLSDK